MAGRQAIEGSKLSKPLDLYQSMSALIEIYFGDQVGFISALTGCAVATAGGIRVRSPGPTAQIDMERRFHGGKSGLAAARSFT